MQEAATILFRNKEANEEAGVIVRFSADEVALCLFIKGENDLEVFMDKDTTRKVIEALNRAVS